jgi:DNA-directed RNA polymerase specialized sigma24 family protein
VTADLDAMVPAIGAGDADAFARWVAGAEASLRASLRPLAAHVDCEAVLQETLLRVWQVAPRCEFDGRPNALLRLGVRIAKNLAIDELRRNRAVPLDEDAVAAVTAVELTSAPDPLLRRVIEDCRRALPDKPAAALTARLESAGNEHDAVLAARLAMKLNTFLQNVARARKLLVACLQKHGVEATT